MVATGQDAAAGAAVERAPASTTAAAVATPAAPPGAGPEIDPEAGAGPERPPWRARRARSLPRLHIGQHAAPAPALDQLQLTGAWFGLRLGRGQDGSPVTEVLFRPEPVRVVLIGGVWAARLVAFRALAAGGRVRVSTGDATGWVDLGRRATGRTDRVAILAPGSPVAVEASSADAPVLWLTGATEPEPGPGEAAMPGWTTWLSVRPEFTPDRAEEVASAGLVLTQRLTRYEATALAAVRRLPARTSHLLQVLQDDMLAVLTAARTRYAWADPTPAEQDALGPPGRSVRNGPDAA